ncbi:MAG: YdcF family protein [Ruminococcus sp.]|nr:YdcF family protein [Ruminococcus sp.]
MKILKMIGRVLGAVAAAVGLVAFIAPVFKYGLLNIGNLTGMVLCGWMLVLCATPLPRLFKRFAVTRWLFRVINVCYAVFLLYGAVVTGAILLACSDTPAPNATAVVLGAQVKGTNPSVILYGRIQAAERYLQENPEAKAVLTGGKGSDEQISEADCMYNVMVAEGIDPQRLIKEDKATDTKENFAFSMQLIGQNGLNPDIAVVTDGFHQFRAKLIAQKQGVSGKLGAVCADTDWVFVPTYTVREWLALPTLLWK